MKSRIIKFILLFIFMFWAGTAAASTITIDASHPTHKVNPAMYGIFYEEINFSGEGGLYAELIRNRGFEEGKIEKDIIIDSEGYFQDKKKTKYVPVDPLIAWSLIKTGDAQASVSRESENPLTQQNPHSLKLDIVSVTKGSAGIANTGFWGISIKKGEKYNLTFYARSGGFKGGLSARLEDGSGRECSDAAQIKGMTDKWQKFNAVFTANKTEANVRFVFTASDKGTLWFDMVSLFPQRTWKNRANGLRPDIMQLLNDLKPGFMRFPGGCIVHGCSVQNQYQWKETINDVSLRPGKWSKWHQSYRSDGLGFHEFLQMCEDFGCPSLYVTCVGMVCPGWTKEQPVLDIKPYIQDTLDAIEYANGPATSKWGALRAKNGHPQPFNIKYVEIGNEDYGPLYHKYYPQFYKAIKEKYPDVITIANTGRSALALDVKSIKSIPGVDVEVLDEHYYETVVWFLQNFNLYDNYDRKGPKIYPGEYACKPGVSSNGCLKAGLAEAVYMAGMERNADIVIMSSYAPIFYNISAGNGWTPDMIYFNNRISFGTPSYHVQKLFSLNRPDVILPVELSSGEKFTYKFPGRPMPRQKKPNIMTYDGPVLFSVCGSENSTGDIILKVINITDRLQESTVKLSGEKIKPTGDEIILTSENPNDENSVKSPLKVSPKTKAIKGLGAEFQYKFKPYSLTILRLKTR